jgi:competence protein ComEA
MKHFPRIGNILIGFLLGLIAMGVINLISVPARGFPIQLDPPPTASPFRIHVNGAVLNPGVYNLPQGSIVQDAINAAGGSTYTASLENINLASPLKDGQLIYIFNSEEIEQNSLLTPTQINPNFPKINLNTADASDLVNLPGIGPSLADMIIEYRQANGPFEDLDDLLAVSGIGPSKLEGIKDYAVVR